MPLRYACRFDADFSLMHEAAARCFYYARLLPCHDLRDAARLFCCIFCRASAMLRAYSVTMITLFMSRRTLVTISRY